MEASDQQKAVVIPCIWSKVTIIHRLLSKFYAEAFKEFDVTNEQFSIMMVLSRREKINQKDLSSFLGLEKSSTSRNVKQLLAKGLVETVRGEDSREVWIQLSNTGKEVFSSMYPQWQQKQAEAEQLFEPALLQSLDRMINILKTETKA